MSQEKKKAFMIKNMILNVILGICTVAIIVCGVMIVRSINDYAVTEERNDQVNSGKADLIDQLEQHKATSSATTRPDQPQASTGESSATTAVTGTEPTPEVREEYREIWEYLTGMKAQYPELFGWIYVKFDDDHIINLPVMQSDDNNYYIDHAYDGTKSKSGAIFADYRNTDRQLNLNQNLIFYGHNMNNQSMFALLSTKYKQRDNFDHVPVTFYTLEGVYTFDIFSIYNAKAGENYDTIAFTTENLKKFCEDLQRRSYFSKKKTFTGSETILTLVTCTNYVTDADGRVIVHGVMEGYESFFVD